MSEARRRVVIIGGGFGGLSAARAMRKLPVDITLVDRRNHHLFQPLLYQVAGAALSPGDIAEPIRSLLAGQDNARVLLGDVESIDLDARTLRLKRGGTVEYDTLVVAAGMTNSWFGNSRWEAVAPGLKTLDDALEIRRRILLAFERAEWTREADERARLLTFVVVGAGPTGVELAGALREIASHTLRRDFRNIRPEEARVILLEGGDQVLPGFGGALSETARRGLERVGVEVLLSRRVTDVDAQGVQTGDARIEAATVLWAAGVAAAPVAQTIGATVDRMGRVHVEPDLSVPGRPDVFVIGDIAHFAHGRDTPLPGVAQVALQMGKHVAGSLRADAAGKPRRAFKYLDLGSMATIGRRRAVADLFGLRFGGLLAWLTWLFVHLMALVGFRNRIVVLTQWGWNYLTFERNSRLIRGSEGEGADSVL
jgi:NADH dehydrogenase